MNYAVEHAGQLVLVCSFTYSCTLKDPFFSMPVFLNNNSLKYQTNNAIMYIIHVFIVLSVF